MKKILQRIKIVYYVLFKYNHFFVMSISREQLIQQLKGEDYDISEERCGLQNYNMNHMIKCWGDMIDEDDMLLQKIQFEAMAEEKINNSFHN